MSTAAAPAKTIPSTIPARLDRPSWSPFHTRMVCGLGAAWILDSVQITIASSVTQRDPRTPDRPSRVPQDRTESLVRRADGHDRRIRARHPQAGRWTDHRCDPREAFAEFPEAAASRPRRTARRTVERLLSTSDVVTEVVTTARKLIPQQNAGARRCVAGAARNQTLEAS
jgi:hypothetical protein